MNCWKGKYELKDGDAWRLDMMSRGPHLLHSAPLLTAQCLNGTRESIDISLFSHSFWNKASNKTQNSTNKPKIKPSCSLLNAWMKPEDQLIYLYSHRFFLPKTSFVLAEGRKGVLKQHCWWLILKVEFSLFLIDLPHSLMHNVWSTLVLIRLNELKGRQEWITGQVVHLTPKTNQQT